MTRKDSEVGRRERRRAETRQKLFHTAMDLFAKKGFFDTTTEDITEAADVGQGTFFNYFPTKQHVLMALFEGQVEKVRRARNAAETGERTVRQVLSRLAHDLGKEPGRSPALTRSLIIAFLSNDEVRRGALAMLASARESLEIIMRAGLHNGEIRPALKPAELAAAFQKRMMGTLFFVALQDKADLGAELEAVFAQFWADAQEKQK